MTAFGQTAFGQKRCFGVLAVFGQICIFGRVPHVWVNFIRVSVCFSFFFGVFNFFFGRVHFLGVFNIF